jgi:hypothetical protein
MSTICKIAVVAPEEHVGAAVEQFLRDRAMPFDVSETEWPVASERDQFNIGEDFPSVLSLKQVTAEVTEIHFNSFGKVEELASHISSALGKNVVVNIYQSVSTSSYWALHAAGQLLRAIEAGDAEVSSVSGQSLPFEGDEPGRAYTEDGEKFMVFDHGEQDWYNREVGVPVEVYQEYEESWKNFLLESHLYEPQASPVAKPWWKFW